MGRIKRLMNKADALILAALVPLISGCGGGGGGGSAALGSLFSPAAGGSSGSSSGDFAFSFFSRGADFLPPGGGDDAIALAHNPEPTSMLLMGAGMAAMAYMRNKSTKSSTKA